MQARDTSPLQKHAKTHKFVKNAVSRLPAISTTLRRLAKKFTIITDTTAYKL